MEILFITDNLRHEHLGIMMLSSVLKMAGHKVDIVQANYNKIRGKLKNNKFPLLAYSVNTSYISYMLTLNRLIKKDFNVLSLFGGPHPTNYPEIINEEGVDGVCIGEGEFAFLDLVHNLTEHMPIIHTQGWWIKQDGQIFRNLSAPAIKDLDNLPFADRKLFLNFKTISVITSRGCIYNCSYCQEKSEYRRRSVGNVIAELQEANANNHAKFVFFFDSTFNIYLSWIKEFSPEYRKRVNLPFYARVRADLVTPEIIHYLKEAGCFSLAMGIETGNSHLRNELFGRGISREQILTAARVIKKNQIRLKIFNMLSVPFGSLEDDLETLRLNIECRPDFSHAYLFELYKNTDIYRSLINKNEFGGLQEYFKGNSSFVWGFSKFSYSKLKLINLRNLFNLSVQLPFLFPIVPFLIKLFISRYLIFTILLDEFYEYTRIYRSLSWGKMRLFKHVTMYYIEIFLRHVKNT